ncbi:MAG: hypothetical protein ACRDXX_09890 [Stackebrandtia sp.]
MTNNELFRQVVKAMATGDRDRAIDLNKQVLDSDRRAYFIFVSAVFAGAVEHRFKDDRSHEAVVRFVNEMRHDFRNAEPPIKPLAVEGLIRALFGEDHFLDDIDSEDQFLSQYAVIRKIVDQSDHMKERFDDYLADAETLARQWASEEG